MEITKASLAEKIVELLMKRGELEQKPVSEYSDIILDIQDLFSNYWDEGDIGQ